MGVLGHERGRQRDGTSTCPCVCVVCQGHLACQYARAMGYKVVAIDSGYDKRKLIESYVIKSFIDINDGDVIDQVRAATGGRGSHAVIVVAGLKDAYKDQSYDEALEWLEQAFDREKVALAASVVGVAHVCGGPEMLYLDGDEGGGAVETERLRDLVGYGRQWSCG
ncbi:uncharacterized protein PITG_17667 [Phytophthora infestans T30-4]|uniref:Alcohol dehydrogenase-like C-terminal domain-containing protein n=2 Tax=Phytophthora infestans TaxID=4787 RepID=D0NWK5_PHYIT|nr:uncharacterized protein PITG_17667 [Phytophthora infestans T30-4]EEY67068.1 conserved hypothetical protein [Phytophthora infestans T30-4]KAF4035741.1 Zinc-binding dehydrogenase [Phytophthora infestans]KAF4146469.1 Zinc-binding dehydrogenase [Phytophthora infestans]|eukprot:XP_002896520.1 conserved hypothetical protein [Phytophthora infestans T30-4]